MTANERFSAHTRSTAFALTLSNRQIHTLLALAKDIELRAKYPWFDEATNLNFGTPEDIAALETTSTVRALVRKGLVVVEAQELPCHRSDVVRPTRAGQLMVELLGEAGFVADPMYVRRVPLHPDDRSRIWFDEERRCHTEPAPGTDRRDPADAPYLSGPHRATAEQR